MIQDDDPPPPPPQLSLAVTPLALGTLASFSIAGAFPSEPFGIVANFGPGFLDLPGFGHVLIDVSSYITVGTGLASLSGTATISALVPSFPAWIGTEVWLQGYAFAPGGATGMLSPVGAASDRAEVSGRLIADRRLQPAHCGPPASAGSFLLLLLAVVRLGDRKRGRHKDGPRTTPTRCCGSLGISVTAEAAEQHPPRR